MEKQRWVDVLKGIAILLVVVGHVAGGELRNVIYMFHMPLFFFISGFLFRPEKDTGRYIVKKTVHLLIPYAVFLTLLNSRDAMKAIVRLGSDPSLDFFFLCVEGFARQVYGGVMLTGVTSVFWFVTCLFFTQQTFNFFVNRYKTKTVLTILVMAYLASMMNASYVPQLKLPFALNTVLAALPFFGAGYFGKDHFEKGWVRGVLLSMFFLEAFLAMGFHISFDYNMKYAKYGAVIVSFLVALGGIELCVWVARIASVVSGAGVMLSLLGGSSLVIMFLHQAIQYGMLDSGFRPLHLQIVRIVFSTGIPVLLCLFLKKAAWARILFLGSYNDFVCWIEQRRRKPEGNSL